LVIHSSDFQKPRTQLPGGTDAMGGNRVNADGLPVNNKIRGWRMHGRDQTLGRDGDVGASNRVIH